MLPCGGLVHPVRRARRPGGFDAMAAFSGGAEPVPRRWSAHGEVVREDAVGGVEDGEDGAAGLVLLDEGDAKDAARGGAALRADRDDSHSGIEDTHAFHTHDLEAEPLFSERVEGLKRCFCGHSQVGVGVGQARGRAPSDVSIPLEGDLGSTPSVGGAAEAKVGEAMTFLEGVLRRRDGVGLVGGGARGSRVHWGILSRAE